jgi:predicted acylesterase/phospholipase RssA
VLHLITGLDSQPHIQTKNMSLYINHAPRYYLSKSRHSSCSFFGAQPGCSSHHRRAKSQIPKRKNQSNGHHVPRSRILPRVQSRREGDGSRIDEDRLDRDYIAILGAQSRSALDNSTRFWRSSPIRSNEPSGGVDPRDRFRSGVRAFASSISSILLNRRMKYLVLGPASMGIFSLIGTLKALEPKLVDVKEISGSSAGSILALLLALGMSVDEILEIALDLDIPKFVKLRIGSFFNKFGFVDLEPIREKLVEVCGCDPTFEELDMKIYVSAYCLNTSSTEYFSRDTHPKMKVIDAVCMSMAIPLIFSCGKYDGKTYVDGGTQEQYPMIPFLDKKPHEITCVKLKMDKVYQEQINNPRQYVEALIRSSLTNRVEYSEYTELVEINVGDTNIFDFNMCYEDKVKLYNIGYSTIK